MKNDEIVIDETFNLFGGRKKSSITVGDEISDATLRFIQYASGTFSFTFHSQTLHEEFHAELVDYNIIRKELVSHGYVIMCPQILNPHRSLSRRFIIYLSVCETRAHVLLFYALPNDFPNDFRHRRFDGFPPASYFTNLICHLNPRGARAPSLRDIHKGVITWNAFDCLSSTKTAIKRYIAPLTPEIRERLEADLKAQSFPLDLLEDKTPPKEFLQFQQFFELRDLLEQTIEASPKAAPKQILDELIKVQEIFENKQKEKIMNRKEKQRKKRL